MIIVPALLTDDREALIKMIKRCESFTDYVQIDIMDGAFVPSQSIIAEDLQAVSTTLKMEVHLMVKSPEQYIEGFKEAGARRLIFHFEATEEPEIVVDRVRRSGLEVGLAINPETELFQIEYLLDEVDSVLFLSVNPGFYGAAFIPEVMDKAKELRIARPQFSIGMDGGIKEDNLYQIRDAGVDMACVGSAILRADDPKDAFLRLTKMVE